MPHQYGADERAEPRSRKDEHPVNRSRFRRLLGVTTVAALAVSALGIAPVSAAETRALYVGDPRGLTDPNLAYTLNPTLVSAGNVTFFDVLVKNQGRQTLTGSAVAMGTLIAPTDGSATGQALPAGWTVKEVVHRAGIIPTCTYDGPAGAYAGFSCSFGNLSRNASGTIRVYLTAGTTLPSPSAIQVSAKVAENVGGNVGSNTNTFYAYGQGAFYVSGAGRVAGLFSGGVVEPSEHGPAPTTINLSATSSETHVFVDETLSGPTCPTVVTCFAGSSTASVNNGLGVSPYFLWTVGFQVPVGYKLSTKTAVVHFFDGGGYEILYNTNQTSCQATKPKLPCADFSQAGTTVTVVFRTSRNGTLRGGF